MKNRTFLSVIHLKIAEKKKKIILIRYYTYSINLHSFLYIECYDELFIGIYFINTFRRDGVENRHQNRNVPVGGKYLNGHTGRRHRIL